MSLALISFEARNLQTGVALPGATVSVYKTGTSTFATIYDAVTNAPIANPLTADATGLVQFKILTGPICDAVWSSGAYTSPRYAIGNEIANLAPLFRVAPEDFAIAGPADYWGAAILAAANSLGVAGGTVQLQEGKTYDVLNDVTLPDGVELAGTLERPDFRDPQTSIGLADMQGIALASTASIIFGHNSGLTNVFVKRRGMTFPAADPSAYAGTALIFAGDGPVIRNVLVVGFQRILGISAAVASCSRYIIDGLYGDGNPAAGTGSIDIDKGSFDTSIIRDVHLWPFGTMPNATQAALTRTGSGLRLRSNQDDTHLDNILVYGYAKNFDFAGTSAINAGKLWSDNNPTHALALHQTGVFIGANVTAVAIDQLQVWGAETGLRIETLNTECIQIASAIFASIGGIAIDSTGGELLIGNVFFSGVASNAFRIANNGSHVRARGYALGVAGALVSAPAGASPNFLDIKIGVNPANGTADGQPMFVTNTITPQAVASAASVNLPNNGNDFTLTGSATVATLVGGYGQRRIRLTFAANAVLSQAGNIVLATAASYQGAVGSYIWLVFDAATSKWVEEARGPKPAVLPPRGHIAGFTLSNNGATPLTKVDVAAGVATDTTNTVSIAGAARTIDFGTVGALGLDTGTIGASTTYHIYAIAKVDGSDSYVASLNAAAPSLPSGYVYARRIGSVRTNASSQILAFLQIEETFLLAASVTDLSTANMGAATALYALTVPTGVKVRPIFDLGTTAGNLLAFSGDQAGYAPGAGAISVAPGSNVYGTANQQQRVTDVYTDTSGRIRLYADAANRPAYIYTRGWIDNRGRAA